MKRSDMIKDIALVIGRQAVLAGVRDLAWLNVEEILDMQEKAGMKPPYNPEGLTNYDIAMGSNVNKWEPEDGEK